MRATQSIQGVAGSGVQIKGRHEYCVAMRRDRCKTERNLDMSCDRRQEITESYDFTGTRAPSDHV